MAAWDVQCCESALLPGQANQRILDNAAVRLGVPPARVISNLAEYGNTSAASIPLALDEAVRANTIAPGHVVRAWHVHGRIFRVFRVWGSCPHSSWVEGRGVRHTPTSPRGKRVVACLLETCINDPAADLTGVQRQVASCPAACPRGSEHLCEDCSVVCISDSRCEPALY